MAYRLAAQETLGAGLRRVIREQTEAAIEQLAAPSDPFAAAHDGRRRIKEIRAALRLLRGELGAEQIRTARSAFAAGADRLAAARDAEASPQALEKLRRHQRLLLRERVPAEQFLRGRHEAARAELTPETLAVVAAMLSLAATAVPAGDGHRAGPFIASLARVYRRGRRRLRRALREGSPNAFHAWRRDAKDLWYCVRLLADTWPGPLAALAEELHALGQLLGDEHDLTVLEETLRQAPGQPPLLTPRLQRAIARRQHHLRAHAGTLGARLYAERPRAFAERLGASLHAWQAEATPRPARARRPATATRAASRRPRSRRAPARDRPA